jgi:hypothetical protein
MMHVKMTWCRIRELVTDSGGKQPLLFGHQNRGGGSPGCGCYWQASWSVRLTLVVLRLRLLMVVWALIKWIGLRRPKYQVGAREGEKDGRVMLAMMNLDDDEDGHDDAADDDEDYHKAITMLLLLLLLPGGNHAVGGGGVIAGIPSRVGAPLAAEARARAEAD